MRDIIQIEKGLHDKPYETAVLGMGCFWGPETRFGSIAGVIRTRVGFAGGTTKNPTYRNLGDHTETIEVDFDPSIVSYESLVTEFWRNHYPNRDTYKGRQYLSVLRYRDESQRQTIVRVKDKMEVELGESIETEIASFDTFTVAEERHQKYYLKRYPKVLEQLQDLYPTPESLVNSTVAARLNGFVKGFGTFSSLLTEIDAWSIEEENKKILKAQLRNLKW